ncbi:MAG: serine/threonine protein kinase [Polyangiaceae bacterium]|nr:serine/threonine protein kinase [Polyangiaceae bacterium]
MIGIGHEGIEREDVAREWSAARKIRVLSRGAGADVLEVEEGGRASVVKVLRRGASLVERARFAREIDALASVRHANVVRIDKVVTDAEGVRAIVMPRLVGSSLRTWLATFGRMPAPFVLTVFSDVLDGLSELHGRGVVHRDLKPSNLFIGREDHERPSDARGIVLDLGLASTASGAVTTGSHLVGSVRYMSPEQLLAGGIDARCDVWGTGVCLFEALTGGPAFPTDDPLEILRHDPVERLVAPTSPDRRGWSAIARVLARALAKRPRDRFASAAAMREALLEARGEVAR